MAVQLESIAKENPDLASDCRIVAGLLKAKNNGTIPELPNLKQHLKRYNNVKEAARQDYQNYTGANDDQFEEFWTKNVLVDDSEATGIQLKVTPRNLTAPVSYTHLTLPTIYSV